MGGWKVDQHRRPVFKYCRFVSGRVRACSVLKIYAKSTHIQHTRTPHCWCNKMFLLGSLVAKTARLFPSLKKTN